MRRRAFIAGAAAALPIALALDIGSFAGEIRKGATMQVKANSIWFEDTAKLTHWQELKTATLQQKRQLYSIDLLSRRSAFSPGCMAVY